MLQIIGWLGCVYLIVKGLELVSSNVHRGADGKMNVAAIIAAVIAFLGAILFVVLLNGQASASIFGSSSSASSPLFAPTSDPSANVMTVDKNLLTPDEMNAVDPSATDVAPTDMNATY